jgi:hypothetical protein
MAEALEKKCSIELVDRDSEIVALRECHKELVLEMLELEKKVVNSESLSVEVKALKAKVAGAELEAAQLCEGEKAALDKLAVAERQLESARNDLRIEQDTNASLEEELKNLRSSAAEAEEQIAEAAGIYSTALSQFGGRDSPLPSETTLNNMLSWLLTNLRQLVPFINGVSDYGALCCVRSCATMLVKSGCKHVEELKKKELEGPEELGETPKEVKSFVRNFLTKFWTRFGRGEVRACAEARRVEVWVFFVSFSTECHVFCLPSEVVSHCKFSLMEAQPGPRRGSASSRPAPHQGEVAGSSTGGSEGLRAEVPTGATASRDDDVPKGSPAKDGEATACDAGDNRTAEV